MLEQNQQAKLLTQPAANFNNTKIITLVHQNTTAADPATVQVNRALATADQD